MKRAVLLALGLAIPLDSIAQDAPHTNIAKIRATQWDGIHGSVER